MRWLDSISDSMDMNLSKLRQVGKDREAQHAAVHGVAKSRTHLATGHTHIPVFPILPTLPSGNHQSVLCICKFRFVHLPHLLPQFRFFFKYEIIQVFVFPYLIYVTYRNALKIHLCCCKRRDFSFLCLNNIPLYGLPRWRQWSRTCPSAGDVSDVVLILGSGRSPGGGNGNPPQ